MNGCDVLGQEGRKALDACVKVKIYGRPQTRRYDYSSTIERLEKCFAGKYPDGLNAPYRRILKQPETSNTEHALMDESIIEKILLPSFRDNYGIIDIYESLVRLDNTPYVEKYPAGKQTDSDKWKNWIDKRREDVEREVREATANPDEQHRYSWLVAQRRVRDCFAGNFAGDASLLERKTADYSCKIRDPYERRKKEMSTPDTCSISDIYKAFKKHDSVSVSKNIEKLSCQRCQVSEEVKKQRDDVDTEYQQAVTVSFTSTSIQKHRKYSQEEAFHRVESCYCSSCAKYVYAFRGLFNQTISLCHQKAFDIFFICRSLCCIDANHILYQNRWEPKLVSNLVLFEKYPSDGPGSAELKELIDAHRTCLEKEYREDKLNKQRYTLSEAERRVRDCFAGSFVCDYTNIFPSKATDEGTLRIDQTYHIFDIQKAIQYFDSKKLVDKYPEEERPGADEKKKVDEERACIKQEYDEATAFVEVEHGSGFIIQDHFIITNKHVIELALNDESHITQVLISNAALGDVRLPCEVAHYDAGKDLALLYCPDLKINQTQPLQFSDQPLLPGMQILSFGFPVSHTGDTALFVNGYVSGSKKMLQGHTMAVLNCPLNSGNSGGPVLCWVEGQLKVVGVATQKHFKNILTPNEQVTIEQIRKMLQTCVIPEDSELSEAAKFYFGPAGDLPLLGKTAVYLLTLKLYDALETHSQFNLSNALPGDQVIDFVKMSIEKYQGDCKDELVKVVEKFCTP